MSLDNHFEAYKLFIESADRVDIRRDLTTRSFGLPCILISIAIFTGYGQFDILLLKILSLLVLLIGFYWFATISALSAKLKAKHHIIICIEQKLKISYMQQEEKLWKREYRFLGLSLGKILKIGPLIFIIGAVVGVFYLFLMPYEIKSSAELRFNSSNNERFSSLVNPFDDSQ